MKACTQQRFLLKIGYLQFGSQDYHIVLKRSPSTQQSQAPPSLGITMYGHTHVIFACHNQNSIIKLPFYTVFSNSHSWP